MCDIKNNTLQVAQTNVESLDAQNICLLIISTVGILLNGFLIFGIHLPKTCSDFVRNLAIVDLCTAVTSVFWVFRELIFSKPSFTIFLITLSWTFVFISFLTIFAVALQRYIAVAYALWTHTVMQNNLKFLRMLSISTWLISTIFCTARLYLHWDIVALVITIIFEVLILSTIILYSMVFKSFRRYKFNDRQGDFSNNNHLKLHLEKEKKLTITVFWVSGVLIVGVLPYIILLQLNIVKILFTPGVLKCNKTLKDFTSYWILLEMLAFSLNPVIYLVRYQVNRSIRQTLLRVICPKRNFRISPEPEGNETNTNEQTI